MPDGVTGIAGGAAGGRAGAFGRRGVAHRCRARRFRRAATHAARRFGVAHRRCFAADERACLVHAERFGAAPAGGTAINAMSAANTGSRRRPADIVLAHRRCSDGARADAGHHWTPLVP